MRLEVPDDLLPLQLLRRNDTLMVLLQGLVLVLILTRQHLILVENDLCPFLLLIVDVVRLIDEDLFLELKLQLLLVH